MVQPAKKQKSNRRARRVLQKPPILGWKTSDEDELTVGRWRGRTANAPARILHRAGPDPVVQLAEPAARAA